MRRALLRSAVATLAAGAPALRVALAQGRAPRPLRVVVPFTPGGSTDLLARAIAPRLALPGQPVIVENRPGAGGSIGAEAVARAEPDGTTLLMGHIGTLAVNPSLYPKLGYDPLRSFVPVAAVARVPNVLVVGSGSPLRTLAALVERARGAGGLVFSSGGNGSAAHIAFESLKLRAGFPATHVPYRGTAPSVTDVIAGQVDATFTGSPAVLPHLRAGRLRALAVSSPERLRSLPEVPNVAESGWPGFEADQWYGLVAPAGTPEAEVARLNAAANAALAAPEVLKQFESEGAVPMPGAPAAFGALIAREIPRWRDVIRAGDVRPD